MRRWVTGPWWTALSILAVRRPRQEPAPRKPRNLRPPDREERRQGRVHARGEAKLRGQLDASARRAIDKSVLLRRGESYQLRPTIMSRDATLRMAARNVALAFV